MPSRNRVAVALLAALLAVAIAVPTAEARAASVPKVSSLSAAGSSTTTAKLGLRWRKVPGATYQVRWASSKPRLRSATRYTTTKNSTLSPALGNICITWYAQVRARKGVRYGAWSKPKALRFSIPRVHVPTPVTTGQTSSSQVQVRWTRAAGAQGYRLHWSPAPFGNWLGLNLYTPYTSSAATGTAISVPVPAAKDHFRGVAYGNPTYAQLQVRRCGGSMVHSSWFPVFPKAPLAGDSSTGNALRMGTYNVELAPTGDTTKMAALAYNIAKANLQVVALQEASAQTATDLIAKLSSAQGQVWGTCGQGEQQVMYLKSAWTEVSCDEVGQPADGTKGDLSDSAKTPLPTPGVHLTPSTADSNRRDIFVVSAHLEDRTRFVPNASIAARKLDAHDAAAALIASIASANPDSVALPTLVAGDLKGTFGGGSPLVTDGYCDESSTPFCQGEGQPTFVRAGYLDSRAAVTKVGIQYGSVNKHEGFQSPTNSGVGTRADFILVKGFPGVSRYVNLANVTFPGLPAGQTPSDHNLVYADLFIPHAP